MEGKYKIHENGGTGKGKSGKELGREKRTINIKSKFDTSTFLAMIIERVEIAL